MKVYVPTHRSIWLYTKKRKRDSKGFHGEINGTVEKTFNKNIKIKIVAQMVKAQVQHLSR